VSCFSRGGRERVERKVERKGALYTSAMKIYTAIGVIILIPVTQGISNTFLVQ
jgi:hypothetical protein